MIHLFGETSEVLRGLMGAAAQSLTLVAIFILIPSILQGAGGAFGKMVGNLNNKNRGPVDRLRKAGESTSQRIARNQELKQLEGNSKAGSFARWRARRRAIGKESEQNLAEANVRYIANESISNRDFARSLAGGSAATTERIANVQGRADDLLTQQNKKIQGTYAGNLNRNASMAAAVGYTFDGTTYRHRTRGVVSEAEVAQYYSGGKTSEVDVGTQAALKFASDNSLALTSNGAKALTSVMAQAGALDTDHITQLAENVRKADGVEAESIFVAHANQEAGSNGMTHLAYNQVMPDGTVRLGGAKGGKRGTADYVLKKVGLSGISKEMYDDPEFGPEFSDAIVQLMKENREQFDRQMAKLDGAQIDKLAAALISNPGAAGMTYGMDKKLLVKQLEQLREHSAKEYKAA